ncbi:F-box protein [Gossypium australe]|uniref:F-box protein n=1 Tax=Gossypium australe TaxID=47621 RepID=A0A5B6UA34_9ROSI|nr:F-box protein [Gossypium australe]
MDSDWAGLSRDLVDLILARLVSVSDYLRFGAVCKTWRSVAMDRINNFCLHNFQCSFSLPMSSNASCP